MYFYYHPKSDKTYKIKNDIDDSYLCGGVMSVVLAKYLMSHLDGF